MATLQRTGIAPALFASGLPAQRRVLTFRHGCRPRQSLFIVKATAEATTATQQETLFTRLGGGPAVRAAVDIFYDKMLADVRVAGFFKDSDMQQQRAHQVSFMTFALGGSRAYNTARMDASHERLIVEQGMTMEAFDVTLGHLAASLHDLGVPEDDIAEAAAVVETLRPRFQAAIDKAQAASSP